ncbi:long-chain-fatty-acid--CoA ligase [Haloferax sp. MBLA0076]|uniref:Long-chain-fatty-acid--CoA ligase n=1 Tax=Haloferax litoreum TaxID=2666140 RepID=A0A6A8GEY9_9EURY|nr:MULTISPECIES: long-chain-fatty-acid--CoA ligase [Haloferax]KAB1192981.1 long-chain-fatty-acid--CoA ligase [Haloferax sp. CBA1148]MRX21469.1 long-chain-fatty-acid--CoA ligase [Haloferax litoreum]
MHRELLATEFLDRARRYYGEMEAVVATTGERFTYDELGERVDRLSAALQARGIEKGDRVAVIDPNTHYHLESAYATIQLGAIHTPLNYRLTPSELDYIANDCGAKAVVADYEYAEKIAAIRDDIPAEIFITNDAEAVEGDWEDFDSVVADADPNAYTRPEMAEDDVAAINYTSGTTGDPKGVVMTHRAEAIHTYLSAAHQEIRDDDVYLWTLPMFHANGWGHIFSITGMGATHVCTRGIDAGDIFETVVDEDVSYMCCAPTVMNMLIDYYRDHEPQTLGDTPLRIASGGAAPPEATMRTLEDEFGWHFKQMYGLTETGPLIVSSDFRRFYDEDSDSRFAVKKKTGIGFMGCEVRVVDEDGEFVPHDGQSIGEVVVRGNMILEEYWNKPEETHEVFNDRREGWFHTGDLATVDEQGFLTIQDRKKDIIISGGENISSLELEDVLHDHPAVSEVAIVPIPSEKWGESPKAYVLPTNGDSQDPGVTADELESFMRESLAGYKVVKEVEFVETLPTTATGKVQKYELRKREWDAEDRMVGEG